MREIEIRPIRSRADMRRFHLFQWTIYRDDPLWVPPLLPERMKVTDPKQGMFFKRGEADFFAAFRDGEMVGTICVAKDGKQVREIGRPEAIFGFFETVDDARVAAALFDRADRWARERGLTSLHGPFNLDYEDGYGVLTDGRDRKPVILCGHTPPYYPRLLAELGFEPARPGNIALAVDLGDPPQQLARLERAADIARRRGRFRIRGADVKNWREEAIRVHHLLNNSLGNTGEARIPWPMEAVESLIQPVLRIADPDLVLFAERVGDPAGEEATPGGPDGGSTVGWFAAIPNMNEVIEHLNGLRYPWDYLRVPWAYLHRPRCLAAKSLLVLPEYHASGASALLFDEMAKRAKAKRYSWIDLSLTSEANPQTPLIAERAGAVRYKRYQVYRRAVAGR
jgi:GNAT superfamily N-acetyltransferase